MAKPDFTRFLVLHAVASYMAKLTQRHNERKVADRAFSVANNAAKKHLLPADKLMRIPLAKLTSDDIDEWQKDFLANQPGFMVKVKGRKEGDPERDAITRTVAQARNLLERILSSIEGYNPPRVNDVLSPNVATEAVDWANLAKSDFGSLTLVEDDVTVSLDAPTSGSTEGGAKPAPTNGDKKAKPAA